MNDNVKKIILNNTQYVSGSNGKIPEDAFSISASQLGKDTLQIYLQMIYGPQPETEVTDATLGTIFHKGMEEIVLSKDKYILGTSLDANFVRAETSRHLKMKNGWYLTGTSDLEIISDHSVQIRDYKLTKVYAGKMYKKDPRNHTYGIQASALTYLYSHMSSRPVSSIVNIIDFFYKDANRMKSEPTHEPIVHTPHSAQEISNMFNIKSSELQGHIDNATIPPVCEDLWPRKIKAGSPLINSKCEWYCGQKHNCPYYKDSGKMGNTNIQLIAGW